MQVDCVDSCEAQQIPSVAQPRPARQVHSSECEIGEEKAYLPGLRVVDCEARLEAEQIPSVAQPSQARQAQSSECEIGEEISHLHWPIFVDCEARRMIRILDKN